MLSQHGLKDFLGKDTYCWLRFCVGSPQAWISAEGREDAPVGSDRLLPDSNRTPLPMERSAPSSVVLPNKSQKPVSVSGFDEFVLQDLAALLENPVQTERVLLIF